MYDLAFETEFSVHLSTTVIHGDIIPGEQEN